MADVIDLGRWATAAAESLGLNIHMQDQMRQYTGYSRVHSGILNTWCEEVFLRNARAYARLHGLFLPKSLGSKILDAGCGTGSFLYYLKQQGYRDYYGIDLCADSIDFVRRHITTQCEQGDMVDYLRANPDSHDAIVMNEVLEHVPKDRAIRLLEIARDSLRADGVLLILLPNMENPATVYTMWHDFTHETGYTQNSIRMVLRWAGFGDIAVHGASELGQRSFKALLVKPARFVARKYLEAVFGYPKGGILFSKRILVVARKPVA